jgi:hypothetical protein
MMERKLRKSTVTGNSLSHSQSLCISTQGTKDLTQPDLCLKLCVCVGRVGWLYVNTVVMFQCSVMLSVV